MKERERKREREEEHLTSGGKRKRVITGERRADGGDGLKGWKMEMGVRGRDPVSGRERGRDE